MSGNPERQAIEQRSALGAALSFEFECSFAAAEANKAAYELLDARHAKRAEAANPRSYTCCPPYERVQVLGGELDTQTAEVIYLKSESLEAEQPVRLALIEPIKITQKEIVFRKMLRRHVKTEYEQEKGQPVLAAMFGDVALPLATFARRKDGLCSYVQIGSEINSDNFHVIASDDLTGRNTVIEAIRAVVDSEYAEYSVAGDGEAAKAKRQQALQALLNIEFAQNKDKLAEAFEAQLVRRCTAEVKPDSWRKLVVLNDDGETYEQKYNIKDVIDRTLFDDKRLVSLVVGRPVEGAHQDVSQLFALTRGILALPLAQLNTSTGQLTFENDALTSDIEQRKQLVYQLLGILRGEPLVNHQPMNSRYYLGETEDSGGGQRKRVAEKIASIGKEKTKEDEQITVQALRRNVDVVLAHHFRIYRNEEHPFLKGELPDVFLEDPEGISEEVRSKADEFMSNPLTAPNPYPHSRVLKVVDERLKRENDKRKTIFTQLSTADRLANIIGDTSVEEEGLVQRLYDMRLKSTVHKGVIENVVMNNTVADAIFQVSIEREGTQFSVTVSGKPEAMADEPLRVLPPFCFSFDAIRPIHEQLNGSKAHLSELLETFEGLQPVKS